MVRKTIKKTSHPLVSVILPVYNAERYLHESIESILNQSFKNFELIIIDDYSSDSSLSISKKYALKDKRIIVLHNNTNLKMAHSLNKGISLAKGKYIARMDADDVSLPDRLIKQVAYMENHPEVGILGGSMHIMNQSGKIIGRRDYPLIDKEIRRKIFRYSPFSHPLIMIRKSVLDEVKYYDPIFNPAEDYDLYFRIGSISKFANLKDVLLKYRIVGHSMTTGSTKKMEQKTIAIRDIYMNSKGFKASSLDTLCLQIHKLSLYILPSSIKIRVFSFFRDSKI